MDEKSIHEADVRRILKELETNIQNVKSKYSSSEDKERLAAEVKSLVDQSERDLKLKIEALIYSRYTKFNVLPLIVPPHKETIKPREPCTARKQPKTSRLLPITPTRPFSAVSQRTQPAKRARTAISRKRLPVASSRDPLEPKKPIPIEFADEYGLDTLQDKGLIDDNMTASALSGMIEVTPFVGDTLNITHETWYKLSPIPSTITLKTPSVGENNDKKESDTNKNPAKKKSIVLFTNGVPDQRSTEFIEFKRNNQTNWEEISFVMKMIYRILESAGIRSQQVDMNIVLDLSKRDLDMLTDSLVTSCFPDHPLLCPKKTGFGFAGRDGENRAAIVIQSIWRGFRQRRLMRQVIRKNAAAKTIQMAFRTYIIHKKFIENYTRDKRRMVNIFESQQASYITWKPENKHYLIEIVMNDDSVQIGRLSKLANQSTNMILYFPYDTKASFINLFKKDRVAIVKAGKPTKIPMTDTLLCDKDGIKTIAASIHGEQVYINYDFYQTNAYQLSSIFNAYVFTPVPSKMLMLDGRAALFRFLKSVGVNPFDISEEIYTDELFASELAQLALGHLDVIRWAVVSNNGQVGWVNTSDISMLEKMKANSEILSDEDVNDPGLLTLIARNIQNDMHSIVKSSEKGFLRNFALSGGVIRESPVGIKGSPSAAFFVPPVGKTKTLGTWERLYMAENKEFAYICPSFSTPREKLKKYISKIASACSIKGLSGTHVIDFFYSLRTKYTSTDERITKLMLSTADFHVAEYSKYLPHAAIETLYETIFDEESMSIGPSTFCFVQPHFTLPDAYDFTELTSVLNTRDPKAKLVSNFNSAPDICLTVKADSLQKLVTNVLQVYEIVASLFDMTLYPNSQLQHYIRSLKFLEQQYTASREITCTVFSQNS